jgi:hypothetical protein
LAVRYGEDLAVEIVNRLGHPALFRIMLKDSSGTHVMVWDGRLGGMPEIEKGATCNLGPLELSPGRYTLAVLATDQRGVEVYALSPGLPFVVEGALTNTLKVQKSGTWTAVE